MTWGRFGVALVAALYAACDDSGLRSDGTCLSARDCAATETCVGGACVPLSAMIACTGDDECGDTQWCDQGTCRAREVITTFPDAGGGSDASAAPDATAGADAGDAPDATVGADASEPLDCTDVGGPTCGANTMCDPATGQCVAVTCATDTSCGAPAAICEASSCVPGCSQPGGTACGMGTVCNTNTGRCAQVAGPCMSDAQCGAPTSVCELGQCVGGCGQPGGIQCSGSTACNAATGRCDPVAPPSCTTDASCTGPGMICEMSVCVAGCGSTGCTGGLVCSATTDRCEMPPPPPMCAPDMYEDNDAAASPTVGLAAGQTFAALTACTMDDDFYAFDLAVGDALRAEAIFNHLDGDIDAQILTPGGTVGVSGSSILDREDISYTAVAAGRHVVRVYLYRDQGTNPGNTYSLRLTHTPAPPPPMCASDRLEENDTQALARAVTVPSTQAALTSCLMDDDFYALTLAPGDEVTARVTFTSAEGDIDLSLLDANATVLDSSTGVTGTEEVSWAAVVPTTIALRVYLYGDRGTLPGAAYDVAVTTRAVCTPDAFEDNDTQAAARAIIAGDRNGLSACDLDDDFYDVQLAANQPITVDLTFAHAEGDIDLALLDSAGAVLVSSVSVDDDESVTFTPTSAGEYTIRVRLYGDLGTRPGNFYEMDARY